MEQIWTIYKLTGMCGRAYVGATKRGALVRWKQHQKDCANGASTYLYNAMRKYGPEWFSLQVLCECYSAREAKAAERAMITVHHTYAGGGNGFNLTYGGDGNWGWKPSEETRARIGAKSAARIASNPEYVRKMVDGQKSRHRPRPGSRAQAIKMGHAKKGTKLSQQQKEKLRLASTGRPKTTEELAKLRAHRPLGIWKCPDEWTRKAKHTKRMDRLHKLALNARGESARATLRDRRLGHV